MASTSTAGKASQKWEKRVKAAYEKLKQQKLVRHKDDMKSTWKNNQEKKRLDHEKALEPKENVSKPFW